MQSACALLGCIVVVIAFFAEYLMKKSRRREQIEREQGVTESCREEIVRE